MQTHNLYTTRKGQKTVCQTIMETKSWMEEEGYLEKQQEVQDERYRDDNDRPRNWDMMTDEDPSDMIMH